MPTSGLGGGLSINRSAFQAVRALSTDLVNRVQFAVRAGLAWGMSRRIQLYQVLGYETRLTIQHYRALYERDGLAQRIVDLPPSETWVAGFQVIEEEDPEIVTEFEQQAWDLCERLNVKQVMMAADQLAGLGHHSAVLIGAGYPGQKIDLSTPLPANIGGPDNVIYLTPFAEDNCRVTKLDTNPASPHYGQPLTYEIILGLPSGGMQFDGIFGLSQSSLGELVPDVHWTRVIHIAEKAHENKIYGVPRLRAVYDYLEALFKVVHGGAEGAWRRMDPGIYIDIDKDLDIRPDPSLDISDEDAEVAAIRQVEQKAQDYYQGMNRFIVGRGMNVTPLNANVKDYGANSDTLLKLIAAATGIPLRILTGSEMGELASSQDRNNANDRASERRMSFAEGVVRQFIDRLVEHKALPKPKLNNGKYQIQWGEAQNELTETEKATVTGGIALANKNQSDSGDTIILTSSEIREKVWGLDPLTKDQLPEPEPPPEPQVVVAPAAPGTGPENGDTPVSGDAAQLAVNRAQQSYKLSSTQIQLPEPIYSKVISLGLSIPDESLAVDSRENNPHVTVKYGLHTDKPELIKALVAGRGSISLVTGSTAVFESADYDVLYVDIESNSLVALNQLISENLQVTNTQPTYIPHATIAYLKPGLGRQYVGMSDLKGIGVTVNQLQFSSSSGEITTIDLRAIS